MDFRLQCSSGIERSMGRTHTYRTFSLTGPGPIEVAPVHGPPPPSSVPLADPRAGINLIKLNHQTNQPPARESTPSVPNQPAAHPGGKGEGPAEQKQRLQTTVVVAVAAGAVAVVSVSAGAAYLFLRSRKKPRGKPSFCLAARHPRPAACPWRIFVALTG